MPSPPPHIPNVLQLLRLAQTTPGHAIALPNAAASVLWLTQGQPLPSVANVLCLQGEVLLDFVDGGFARLRTGDLCNLTQPASAVPVQETALLLLLGQTSL